MVFGFLGLSESFGFYAIFGFGNDLGLSLRLSIMLLCWLIFEDELNSMMYTTKHNNKCEKDIRKRDATFCLFQRVST